MEENKVIEGAAVENAALEAEAKPAKPAKEAIPAKEAKPAEEAPKRVANEDFNWDAFENDLDLYGGNKEAAKEGGKAAVEAAKAAGWTDIKCIEIAGVQGDATNTARMVG